VKAEFNHKSYAERYNVEGNTRHTCYVCTLFWALFIIATWVFCTFINLNNSTFSFTNML